LITPIKKAIDAHIVSVDISGSSPLKDTFSNLQALNMLSFSSHTYQNTINAYNPNAVDKPTDWYFNSTGFDPQNQLSDAFGQLKAGDTLVFSYTLQFEDASGFIQSRPVNVTVTGTNDAPVITTHLFPDINVVKDASLSYLIGRTPLLIMIWVMI
jgi:VCBS repeat-containing protein